MKRRDFLKLTALPLPAMAGWREPSRGHRGLPLVPRVNGGVNVQPLRRFDPGVGRSPPLIRPELVDLQMQLIYELGFEWIRMTISFDRFGPDFLAAIPYVRACRALGIHVLGIIGQFTGFDLLQALTRPDSREEVLDVYLTIFDELVLPASPEVGESGRFAAQLLNEPTNFHGISPRSYVRDFLAPSYVNLKEDDPLLTVVSAASLGNVDGILRTREMLDAGLGDHCDAVAFHVYRESIVPELASLARSAERPIWITESGVSGADRHLSWATDSFDRMRAEIPGVEQIFFFDLFDFGPERFRLVEIRREADGSFLPVVESDALVEHYRTRVREAGEGEVATYPELISDIQLYFPTEEDFRLIESTSFR